MNKRVLRAATRRHAALDAVLRFVTVTATFAFVGASLAHGESTFQYQEVMVPMRDGIRLQTVILTPIAKKGPLPILLKRTPYGVPEKAPEKTPPDLQELADDGYIFVYQNLRGRFKSEGVFALSSRVDLADPKAVNETTDAYDTIDWLVKNVPSNGRVGIWGVSYLGLTAGMTLLRPHAALKAVSEQASPVDQWMNDDMHRFGALRLSYAFEYSVMEQADKNKNTHFDFSTYDTYQWYLDVGPLKNLDEKYLHGSVPFWTAAVAHPDYDDFWKGEAWVRQLHSAPVPNLNVAGFWDQEDPWGPWQIFEHSAEHDPDHNNYLVAGPWLHGQWQTSKAESIGSYDYGGHDTAREFRHDVEAPFFRHFLHGDGDRFTWRVKTFQSGSNTWQTYDKWPPPRATATKLYLRSDGALTFEPPKEGKPYREYVSDPANPVPYRPRPISPTYPGGDWPSWETDDQRFADHRPDVLTYVSAPLEKDLMVTGKLEASLYASTSGSDSDFVVKLIDVFPEDAQGAVWDAEAGAPAGQYGKSLNGYELPIAMEVRRGRYLESFEKPKPLQSGVPVQWDVPLRDRDHVFRKGHRIMVQIQSTWFPLIDRNPQKYVSSIYQASEDDFVKATQRVYCTPTMPSYVVLPVIGGTGGH
jgi:putative CocE/NonD family hydrolase